MAVTESAYKIFSPLTVYQEHNPFHIYARFSTFHRKNSYTSERADSNQPWKLDLNGNWLGPLCPQPPHANAGLPRASGPSPARVPEDSTGAAVCRDMAIIIKWARRILFRLLWVLNLHASIRIEPLPNPRTSKTREKQQPHKLICAPLALRGSSNRYCTEESKC